MLLFEDVSFNCLHLFFTARSFISFKSISDVACCFRLMLIPHETLFNLGCWLFVLFSFILFFYRRLTLPPPLEKLFHHLRRSGGQDHLNLHLPSLDIFVCKVLIYSVVSGSPDPLAGLSTSYLLVNICM